MNFPLLFSTIHPYHLLCTLIYVVFQRNFLRMSKEQECEEEHNDHEFPVDPFKLALTLTHIFNSVLLLEEVL